MPRTWPPCWPPATSRAGAAGGVESDQVEVSALRWSDLAEADAGDGMFVAVRRSKTNPAGETRDVRFVKDGVARAIRALRTATNPGPGDRVVPLSPQMVWLRFAAAAKAAGLDRRRDARRQLEDLENGGTLLRLGHRGTRCRGALPVSGEEVVYAMKSLAGPFWWIGAIVVAAFGTWLKLFFGQFLPSPQQVRLAIANAFKNRSPRPEQRFRLVLCWLENDRAGRDTGTVAEAFTGVEGIELVRFHRVVSAPGAADDWRPSIRKGALAVLKTWNADLAVVGSVKDPGKALSLWFVPREGDGTLRRGDLPYELVNVRLQDDFHDDLRAQLTAEALRVAAPLAETEVRGRVLEKGLNGIAEKIAALLEGGVVESERRASLNMALGAALVTLGEREPGDCPKTC